ncbi:MAG TPA: TonB family protein [Stellaceae bacterium]|nr:TonB family protein [Stellaceae bacterium]
MIVLSLLLHLLAGVALYEGLLDWTKPLPDPKPIPVTLVLAPPEAPKPPPKSAAAKPPAPKPPEQKQVEKPPAPRPDQRLASADIGAKSDAPGNPSDATTPGSGPAEKTVGEATPPPPVTDPKPQAADGPKPTEQPKDHTAPTPLPIDTPQKAAAAEAPPPLPVPKPPAEQVASLPRPDAKPAPTLKPGGAIRPTPKAPAPSGAPRGHADIEGEAAIRDPYYVKLNQMIERFAPMLSSEVTRGRQGTTKLRIVIDKQGNVFSVFVEESSGYPTLDQIAVEMVYRAAPFPPVPDYVARDSLIGTLVLPFPTDTPRMSKGE